MDTINAAVIESICSGVSVGISEHKKDMDTLQLVQQRATEVIQGLGHLRMNSVSSAWSEV